MRRIKSIKIESLWKWYYATHLWISLLPALMEPPGLLAQVIAHRMCAVLGHTDQFVAYRVRHRME